MKPYEIAAEVKPSERQLNWQKTEFYGFINFGLATVLNREWTDGGVNPVNFNPEEFDAQEWVQFFKDAGFKGKKVGGAEVSNMHANFIINNGNSGDDIYILMRIIKMIHKKLKKQI